jgi:hypothetical protein
MELLCLQWMGWVSNWLLRGTATNENGALSTLLLCPHRWGASAVECSGAWHEVAAFVTYVVMRVASATVGNPSKPYKWMMQPQRDMVLELYMGLAAIRGLLLCPTPTCFVHMHGCVCLCMRGAA